jgi:hypothetical protein
VPPAFVSELYHGAEDSTESTGQSSSQEDVGNGESIPSEAPKVRHEGYIRTWAIKTRMNWTLCLPLSKLEPGLI